MITIDMVKKKLLMDSSDTSQDAYIQNEIDLAQNVLIDYCNNDSLDFSLSSGLDAVVLYMVLREVNPETKLRAGKTSDNMGFSVSYLDDLPRELRKVLKKYRRLNIL